MPDDIRETIDRLANALQTVSLLATRLKQQLEESAQDAVHLEAAAEKAVSAMSGLRPDPRPSD